MRCLLLTAALLLSSTLQAEEPHLLSFEQALDLAFSHNASLRASEQELEAMQDRRRAAFGLRLPSLGLTGTFLHLGEAVEADLNELKEPLLRLQSGVEAGLPEPLRPMITSLTQPLLATPWSLTIQEQNVGFVAAELTLPIWMGGRINAANRAAAIEEERAALHIRATRGAIVSALAECYFGFALAREAEGVAREAVKTLEAHRRDALALKENGMVPEADLLYVEYRLREAEQRLLELRLQKKSLHAALDATLGIALEAEPATALFILHEIAPLDAFRTEAEARNSTLKEVALERQLAHEGVRAARGEGLPEVAAFGGGSLCDYRLSGLLPRWAVGIGVRWRLFNGLNHRYRHRAARAVERQVEALEDQARSEVGLLVEKLYHELEFQSEHFQTLSASIRYAEEYLRTRRVAFREGVARASELLDAELELRELRMQRLECAYHFDVALARLLEATDESDKYLNYIRCGEAVGLKNEEKR